MDELARKAAEKAFSNPATEKFVKDEIFEGLRRMKSRQAKQDNYADALNKSLSSYFGYQF